MVHPSPGQLRLTRANKNTHKELYTRDSRDRPLDKKNHCMRAQHLTKVIIFFHITSPHKMMFMTM